jgi:hypothetical protein
MEPLRDGASRLDVLADRYARAASRLRARGMEHTAVTFERLANRQRKAAAALARLAAAWSLARRAADGDE